MEQKTEAPDTADTLSDAEVSPLNIMGFDPELYTDESQLATEIGASVLGSAFVTAFAQKKLYNIKKRKDAIKKAHKIRIAWEKELFKNLAVIMPDSSVQNSELMKLQVALPVSNQLYTRQELHSFIQNLHTSVNAPLAHTSIANSVIPLPESPLTSKDYQRLKTFRDDLGTKPQQTHQDKERVQKVNKVLNKLGITIDYRTDKLIGFNRKAIYG